MFYKKWFDEGDLVLYSPNSDHVAYDDDFNSYTIENSMPSEIGVFLGYLDDDFNWCNVFVSSRQKSEIIPQSKLKILSKKR
tara:strand:- start:4253 stop:4495 length:243 start_codon:yes stop_codon:yes gene_type:complete